MNSSNSQSFLKTNQNQNNNQEEFDLNYRDDPLYKHLNILLFKLLSEHKIKPTEKFDKNIFFLKNNNEFQEIVNNNKTIDGPYLGFLKLLEDLNSNGKNFRNLNIEVRKFINEFSRQICEYTNRMNNADDMIKHFKMDEMKEIVIDKLSKERQNYDFLGDITEVKFSIRQIENFPEGNFSLKLICESFDDNDSKGNRIILKEILSEIQNKRQIAINPQNINNPVGNLEYFETIYLRNESNYEYLNLNECDLSKSKFHEEASYMGLLINSFKFIVEKDEENFCFSEQENMIDTFINNLEVLLKDKPFKISSSCMAYVDKGNKHLIKAGMDRKYVIYYDMEINFNKKVKILILEKIFTIFQDTINAKYDNEKLINCYLDHFPEIKEEIKALTKEKKIEERDKCACCNIF